MKSSNSLGTLGALSVLFTAISAPAWAAAPSSWTCEACPYEKESVSQAQIDVGVGVVSDKNARFADFTGMDRKGTFGVLGGSFKWLGDSGWMAALQGQDLGLSSRSASAEWGLQGKAGLKLGYSAIPRSFAFDTVTPFQGVGSSSLTLPAGFPAADTGAMPLSTTLHSAELGVKRALLDLGAHYNVDEHFSVRVDTRHDTRDGTQRTAGSFFANTSQMVMPVNQVTDQFEVVGRYFSKALQMSLGYQASLFRNGDPALTWSNPFNPVVTGATTGRLALAPNNEFHQTLWSLGYEFNPDLRLSADVASGKMTQDAAFVPATSNPTLNVLALPSSSLHGSASTLNASVRLTATPSNTSRLTVIASRDDRTNDTPVGLYPAITTDMWVGTPVNNSPYSFRQDKVKLLGDVRFWKTWNANGGAEADETTRSLQEVSITRESKIWAKVSGPLMELGTASLKVLHATRFGSKYQVLASIVPAENPLMRKFNLADRIRDAASLRTDFAVADNVSFGVAVDAASDNYNNSPLGLRSGQSVNMAADLSWAVTDGTSVHAFANEERVRSVQAGSAAYAAADWTGRARDVVDVVGLGLKHLALGGKLKLTADWVTSRGHGAISVEPTGVSTPGFPTASTASDAMKFQAAYQLQDQVTLIANLWYEKFAAQDWRLDGVTPAAVPNLLSLGQQPGFANVKAISAAVRYRF